MSNLNGKLIKVLEVVAILAAIVIGAVATHYSLAGDVRINEVRIQANASHIQQLANMDKDIAEIKRDVAVIKDRMERERKER